MTWRQEREECVQVSVKRAGKDRKYVRVRRAVCPAKQLEFIPQILGSQRMFKQESDWVSFVT